MAVRFLAVFTAAACLAGCASVQPVQSYRPLPDENVVEKSYELNRAQSAYVGEAIIRLKDYRVRRSQSQSMRADRDFEIRFPPFGPSRTVRVSDSIQIHGTTDRDGVSYTVVKLPVPEGSFVGLLINPDGTFEGSGISLVMANSRMGYSYKPNPPDVRLTMATTENSVLSEGFRNFEIVYSGTTKDEINLLYREYTANDMARPAFSQSLVYSKESKTIRFREFVIEVDEANNELIRFRVVQDGPAAGG